MRVCVCVHIIGLHVYVCIFSVGLATPFHQQSASTISIVQKDINGSTFT